MEGNTLQENLHVNSIVSIEDINLRAALIHVLGDLIQSIGVLVASGLIWYNDSWRLADPICTLLFSIIVIISTLFISRDILRILMEGKLKIIVLYLNYLRRAKKFEY